MAEGAGALAGRAICPAVTPDLPRQLASKLGLYEICRRFGVPTPDTSCVKTGDLEATLADLALPVVVKQNDPSSRLTRPVVTGSAVVRTAEDVRRLRAAFDRWPEGSEVVVQEYLPDDDAEDWFADGYCTASSDVVRGSSPAASSGRGRHAPVPPPTPVRRGTMRSSAPCASCAGSSATAASSTRTGDTTEERAPISCSTSTLAFGAQFRMFEDDRGVDVVRAMHLDLSGRPLNPGRQVDGERFLVENFGLAASVYYRGEPQPPEIPGARHPVSGSPGSASMTRCPSSP